MANKSLDSNSLRFVLEVPARSPGNCAYKKRPLTIVPSAKLKPPPTNKMTPHGIRLVMLRQLIKYWMCSPDFESLVNCLKFEGVMNMMNSTKSAGVASPICQRELIMSPSGSRTWFASRRLWSSKYLNAGVQELFPSENELWSSEKPEHQNDEETEHDGRLVKGDRAETFVSLLQVDLKLFGLLVCAFETP